MATNNTNDTLTFEDFVENDVAIVIWIYLAPILILIGTVGSITSIVVLATKKMRSPTTMFYLVLLSLTDIIVLNTGLLHYWVVQTFDYDIRLSSSFSCKIHTLVVYLATHYASWTLVLLTLDRCFCVCLPFSAVKFCTKRTAHITSAVMFCVLLAVDMHYIWTSDLIEGTLFGSKLECYVAAPEFSVFLEDIWPWIDLSVLCGIPAIIMIISNILIIRQLIQSDNKMSLHSALSGSVGVGGCPESQIQSDLTGDIQPVKPVEKDKRQETIPSETAFSQSQPRTERSESNASTKRFGHKSQKMKRISSLTVMLLSINIVFLFLLTPITVYDIIFGDWREHLTPHSEARMALAWAIVNMLMYTDSSIHFFLYFLTMPSFRKHFFSICRRTHKIKPIICVET